MMAAEMLTPKRRLWESLLKITRGKGGTVSRRLLLDRSGMYEVHFDTALRGLIKAGRVTVGSGAITAAVPSREHPADLEHSRTQKQIQRALQKRAADKSRRERLQIYNAERREERHRERFSMGLPVRRQVRPELGERRCDRCRQIKHVSDFAVDPGLLEGIDHLCIDCRQLVKRRPNNRWSKTRGETHEDPG